MSTNRVNKILVTTGVQLANMADVDPGQYLVIDAQSGATLTAASILEVNDFFQVVVNDPSGAKVFSDKIRVGDITSYQKQDYAAKTEQVITWTPPTPVAGTEYQLSIIDKSDKDFLQARQNKRTYTVTAATGETAETLLDKFRDQIDADASSNVIASGTTTLILTADATANVASGIGEYSSAQVIFDVFPSQYDASGNQLASGSVAYTTAAGFGSGQFYQVRTKEQLAIGYTGVTNRRKFPIPTGNFLSVAGTNYDAVIIEFDNRHDTNVVVEGEKRAPETLEIYITADAGDSTIIPILDAIANRAATAYANRDAV